MTPMIDHAANLFILAIMLGMGVLAFTMLSGNQPAQALVGIVIAVSYAVWGLLHHWSSGDLHRKVVVEYVLIGSIAVAILLAAARI